MTESKTTYIMPDQGGFGGKQKSILTNNYENRIAISDATASLKDSVNFVGL
jgi:hypothetical protein